MENQIDILIIEPNQSDAENLINFLGESKSKKFNINCVNNLSDGLDSISNFDLDIILLDISLSESEGLSGFQILSEYSKNLPIIVITALEDEKTAIEAMRSGAQDYIIKNSLSSDLLVNSIIYSMERNQIQNLIVKEKELISEAYEKLKTHSSLLVKTDKMSTVGILANGIAQELNSPIMGINSAIQYCLEKLNSDDELYSTLKEAEKATIYCSEIVKNLISFSSFDQTGAEDFIKGSIKEIIEEVRNLISYRLENDSISFTLNYDDTIPELWMNQNSLKQAFLNLTTNSLDAMESSDNKELKFTVNKNGNYIEINLEDTGCGISHENLQQIFDPFFTTKSQDKGTGLGLSICRNIIDQHAGMITCDSELGEGTNFKIVLPLDRRLKN